MNILFYNSETLEPIMTAFYSHPVDIPTEKPFIEIKPEDMDYHLEVVKNKKTGKITYKRGEEIYSPEQVRLQKHEFRKRLTLVEKLWWDNYEEDKSLTSDQSKMVKTIMKDFDLSPIVDLQDPEFKEALEYLASIGKIQSQRVKQLLQIKPRTI